MKLNPIAANQNEVVLNNGDTIFFSYKTPVAAYLQEKGYIRTEKFWSVTTSRHNATELPQEVFNELV